MKKVIRKAALILVFVVICCVSYGTLDVSAAEDFYDMGNKTISDVNKVWTLKFSTPIVISSLNNNVVIQDITDGSTVNVNISGGNDENSVKVNPPSGGYKISHNYKLTVDKSIKSKNGVSLSKPAVLRFSLTSKESSSYNASANVIVSPVVSIFKQITVSSTSLPSGSKYKIDGNNNLLDFGSSTILVTSQSTVKVSIYDNRGNLLGTSTLDVSSTKNNVSMNVTLTN